MNLAIDFGFVRVGRIGRVKEVVHARKRVGVWRERCEREREKRVRERSLKGDWGDGSVHSGAGAYHEGLSCEILR